MSKQFFVEVEASLTFFSNLRKLAKKYRNIQQDIQPIIETLKQGQLLGEQIPRVKYSVFKIRVRNSDIQKGKSGGYRLIYYLKTKTSIVLLIIYSKSDQANLTPEAIRQIIEGEKDY